MKRFSSNENNSHREKKYYECARQCGSIYISSHEVKSIKAKKDVPKLTYSPQVRTDTELMKVKFFCSASIVIVNIEKVGHQ